MENNSVENKTSANNTLEDTSTQINNTENNKTPSESSKTTEEDGLPTQVRRSLSISSFTDSLETDDQSQEQAETEDSKPKKKSSKLPVKTKPKLERSATENCNSHASGHECGSGGCGKGKGKKSGKQLRRDCNSLDCNSTVHHAPTKETITSRMRVEKSHLEHGMEANKDEYLTPTQRKGQTIRDLKKQVKELEKTLEETNGEVESLRQSIGKEAQIILDTKNQEVKHVKDNLESMETKYDELTLSYEESVKAVNALETTIQGLRESAESKELHHKKMYLEMYEKGRMSARFEREDELEMLVKTGKEKVTMTEMMKKLSESQAELAKWQSLRREEMYEVAEKPETEAETTLRFLKDSFFHFLTTDKDSDDHLRAMIRIFNFSEVQKKKITKGLSDKKKSKPIT
ncbi:protein quick-to-court-like [Haliotis rubra]|uniref:protein quick-to-court-like n=1 Tax=Haliotis rubra TaxID=36100 RepID=UPI001EE5CA57|nr:protein quick-to-court-like [Haliotis rubra]XP_046546321.1 protein quick-to-court-like [Haliotis rubra]